MCSAMQCVFLILNFMMISTVLNEELPKEINTCHRNDPNVNACLNAAVESSLKILKNGISVLSVPPIEPMKIDSIVVEQEGATSAFNLKSSFKNAEIHGLSTSKLLRTVAKFKKFNMKSETFTQRMDFVGQYNMNGHILVLPIRGEGFANVSMHELTTRHEIFGEYFKRDDGNVYVNITTYKIKFKPKWVTFRFDNLFNGDKLLGNTMNTFMNDNWQPVFDGIIPGYEYNFGIKFKNVANTLFHKVPFEVVFPE